MIIIIQVVLYCNNYQIDCVRVQEQTKTIAQHLTNSIPYLLICKKYTKLKVKRIEANMFNIMKIMTMTMMILISACSCVLGNTHATFIHQNVKRIAFQKVPGAVISTRSRSKSPKQFFLSFGSSNENNSHDDDNENNMIKPNSLMDMDVIIYTMKNDSKQIPYLGAIQEDSTLAPLSAWTTEPAFGNYIECVVHEDDRWIKELNLENIMVRRLLSEDAISYGSRQVGGGKGLGNPHGEESELVYYVDNNFLEEENVDIPIKPDLEILW